MALYKCVIIIIIIINPWGTLQQLVNRQKFKNIDHLKQFLNRCWVVVSQELINGAIGQ